MFSVDGSEAVPEERRSGPAPSGPRRRSSGNLDYTGRLMPFRFRYSICNEIFEGTPFHQACRTARAIGYDGIEIAPFTLADSPASLRPAKRNQYRGMMNSEGLCFAGLHWLMV